MAVAPPRRRFPSDLQAGALLLAVVLTVNGVAVWGILSAREEARTAALQELGLQTDAHARAVEAALATLRGDFIFLSYSPPLSRAPAAGSGDDPVTRRWSRLAIEASIILFMEAHPAVDRLQVRTVPGGILVSAGRRQGVPVLLAPKDDLAAGAEAARRVRVSWALGPERAPSGRGATEEPAGSIDALLDPARLIADSAPGLTGRLTVELGGGGTSGVSREDEMFVARSRVRDESWTPPIDWTLVRREDSGRIVRSVERLAGRYRTTLLVNVGVMALTLMLGLVAFRQARRAARAEAEREQQALVGELERQVRHNQRLASLGRLSAGIAHEINNPLEGMRNYLAVLEEDLERGDTEGASGLAGRVREGLDRIAVIVRQVLRFGEPGRAPSRAVDLDAVVRDTLDLVRADRRFEGIEVRADLDLGEGRPIHGSPTTLGQLVLNLVINACLAQQGVAEASGGGGDGGEGAVTVTTAAVPAADGPERAVLTVSDRGPGFTAEALEHLFEPFFSTRDSTGLGLAVAHGIAAEHGGSIRGENRQGGGARVVVELPFAPPSGNAVAPEEPIA
jgi:signal transduction histidine kinase